MVARFFTRKDRLLLNVLNQDKKNLMVFMKRASFEFMFDSEKEAKIVLRSLNPEVKNKIPKTNVKISVSKKKLSLEIESDDVSSLRAACNSYLRWINTALAVKKTV